jgi:hypothetical protein
VTRIIRCAADARDLDFLVMDDCLHAAACDVLANVYRESEGHYETWHKDPFWKGRLLGRRDVPKGNPADFMEWGLNWARRKVGEFYDAPPLHADVLHLVGWPTGWKMTPHADNAHESGEQHEFHWRDYSGVLYLNDDFGGGGLYLPKQDILIEPRKGMLVSLPCGLSHVHGVQEITSGLRITLAFFLTTDIAHADRGLLNEV